MAKIVDNIKAEENAVLRNSVTGAFVCAYKRVFGEKARIKDLDVSFPCAYRCVTRGLTETTSRDYSLVIRRNMFLLGAIKDEHDGSAARTKEIPCKDYPDTYAPEITKSLITAIIEELGSVLSGKSIKDWDCLLCWQYAFAVADLIEDDHPQKFSLASAYARLTMEMFAADGEELGFNAWDYVEKQANITT